MKRDGWGTIALVAAGIVAAAVVGNSVIAGIAVVQSIPRTETWSPAERAAVRQFADDLTDGIGRVIAVEFIDGVNVFHTAQAVVTVVSADGRADLGREDFETMKARLLANGWTVVSNSCEPRPIPPMTCVFENGDASGSLLLRDHRVMRIAIGHNARIPNMFT